MTTFLHNILIEDLIHIEQDLNADDKLSLLFLLYGVFPESERHDKLLQAGATETALRDWALKMEDCDYRKYWRLALIQGLHTTQSFGIMEKLGLDVPKIKTSLQNKSGAYRDTYIQHPILKVLFKVCDNMVEKDRNDFLDYIKVRTGHTIEFETNELIMSELIARNNLKLGGKTQSCDLNLLTEFLLTSKDLQSLWKTVKDAEKSFNKLRQKMQFMIFHSASKALSATNDHRYLERYTIRNEFGKAGKVLIINQMEFSKDSLLKNRIGSDLDCQRLVVVFDSFRMEVEEPAIDLTRDQMRRKIKQFVQKIDDHDSVFVCVMSHGQSGVVFGVDGKELEINEIRMLLQAENLNNKPKVLIVQACQGDVVLRSHSTEVQRDDVLQTDGGTRKVLSAEHFRDFLLVQSTVDGFASLRDTEKGSWFIQSFCKCLNEMGDDFHLQDILTATKGAISKKDHEVTMVSTDGTTFVKSLYFPKRETKLNL